MYETAIDDDLSIDVFEQSDIKTIDWFYLYKILQTSKLVLKFGKSHPAHVVQDFIGRLCG